jgi:hypothetical protein
MDEERWLCGREFTAADVAFAILLQRMILLGLDARYFPARTCPAIHHYLQQLQRRPTFKAIQQEVASLRLTLLWEDLKAASPYVIAVGSIVLAAALAFVLARRM